MFTKLIAENFLSWANLEFDFKSGVTLIEGFNFDDGSSEGSGKSAIPNALCWALFGQVPKDVNIDEVIRSGQTNCTVTVYINDNTQIVRKRGPNDLYIITADGQKIKGKDVKETQKRIQELIGMSFETFCQSVLFAQNYPRKFITASEEDKAKIFSELQDLSWCDRAAKKTTELFKEVKASISGLESKMSKLEGSLSVYKANITTYEQLNKQFESDKEKELQSCFIRIKTDQETINKYKEALESLKVVDSTKTLRESAVKLQADITSGQKQVDEYAMLKFQHERALKLQNCPTCGQTMPEKPSLPALPPEPAHLKQEIDELKKQLVDSLRSVDLENQRDLQRKEIQFKVNLLEADLKNKQANVELIEKKPNVYGQQIEQTNSNITLVEAEINKLQLQMNEFYEKSKSLETLRAGFRELKSHVFSALLNELNAKANGYIQDLFDVPASIQFSNLSEDGEIAKITSTVTLDGVERSIGLLSGGQFRRVQIAVDFALSEIVSERNGKSMSLRILDEPFKDLSEIKMEKVIGILERMKGSTIIIEHNSMIRTIVNQVFKVEFRNGVSVQS